MTLSLAALRISLTKSAGITGQEAAWIRYSFGATTCALAIVSELYLDRITSDRIYPFLPAVASIIAAAACAGSGPGLLATALMVTWSGIDLHGHGVTAPNIMVRCIMLLLEGIILSIGSARMWRSMREAGSSEQWHRQLVETAAEGIWVHDENGVITYANARMAEMVEAGAPGLLGRNVDEFFLPADLSMERIRAANLRSGRKEQFDRRLRREDGSEIWVLTCCNLIGIGDNAKAGEKSGALAMMTDITERKRAETALRRSEERFRNLFEGVLEGVYQSTPDGRITQANPMLLRMLGMTSEAELNDVNIARDLYIDPYIRQHLLERLERENGFQNIEYELRRRDGGIITVLENARAVRDETGAVLHYEGTLTDITPRKRIEEQLRRAQKVEALGRLAGGVANDFNNVLTIITGFAQLAQSDLPPLHPARTSTEQVLQASERAMDLTRQLLLFSRRQAPAEGSLDLNRAIEQSHAVRQAGLVVSLFRESLPVYLRQKQIEAVIQGLSDSVRRSFPSAGLQLKTEPANPDEDFRTRCGGAQPGTYTVLFLGSVGDEAEGTGPPELGKLLTDPTVTAMEAGESAAMGLSTTHATIAQCGGFIVRSSSPLGGQADDVRVRRVSGFHVFLPSALAPLGDAGGGAGSSPAGETILLVEDEPLVRDLSRDMLERQGYRVTLASDAKEAEQISSGSDSFDLLITDRVMPNISGAELARRLRAAHPGLKVLFISGYADDDPPERDEPGASFLQKPFSADSLGRKIRQMLSRV